MAQQSSNILIYEHDSRQTELMMDLIRDVSRARIDSTTSGERALELLSQSPYQLVIAECRGTEMDGLSFLERVKRTNPATSVILTSTYASIEECVKAMRLGADEYFKKPFNPDQFKFAIQRSLDRRDLFGKDNPATGLMHLLNACQLLSTCLEEEKVHEAVMGFVRREALPKGIALFRCKGTLKEQITTSSDMDAEVVNVIAENGNYFQLMLSEKNVVRLFPKTKIHPEILAFKYRAAKDAHFLILSLSPRPSGSIDDLSSRFRMLQSQIAMTWRNIKNFHGVKKLLYTDEPTSLYNTRFLHFSLDQSFERRNKEKKGTFSVLFLDVDHFKSVNDRHGHLYGTQLLHEIGELVRSTVRETDLCFRYGGDEFVVLLEGAKKNEAFQVAEKIRKKIETHQFLNKENLNLKLTVSIGVASCPEHAKTKREIIEAADAAMYHAKKTTRNKVYLAERKIA